MISWSYVLPRLLVLGAVSLFLCFALDPLLRYSAVLLGQQVTGARVDIDSLSSSLPYTAFRLDDVEVADPEDPDANLVQAQQVTLKFDPHELLRRRYVVEHGQVLGLELGGGRAESGALDDSHAAFQVHLAVSGRLSFNMQDSTGVFGHFDRML